METGTEKNIAANDTLELTTEIVAAYVSNNPVQSSDLS